MFGLSMKERLYKAFMNLCETKLPVFRKEMRDLVLRAENMSEEEAGQAYAAILQHYTSAITEEIHRGLPPAAGFRVGAAMMRPSITGLPEEYDDEFDNSLYAGKYFAIYYYAMTGKQIDFGDYGKYMRPINQRQVELMNGVLQELSE